MRLCCCAGTDAGAGVLRSFRRVVSADRWNDAVVLFADAGDDRGQGVGEFRADQQQPFLRVLGRHDLQQGDDLAGIGQAILHQREVGDFEEFFEADAGVAQRFDYRPRPERVVLVLGDVALAAGSLPLQQDGVPARVACGLLDLVSGKPAVVDTGMFEGVVGLGFCCDGEEFGCVAAVLLGCFDDLVQVWKPFADPLVHGGDAALLQLDHPVGVTPANRAWNRPWCPGRVVERPFLDVEVERAHPHQDGQVVAPRARGAVGFGDDLYPLFPRLRGLR